MSFYSFHEKGDEKTWIISRKENCDLADAPPSPLLFAQPNDIAQTNLIPPTSSTYGGPTDNPSNHMAETHEGVIPDGNPVELLSMIIDQFVQQGSWMTQPLWLTKWQLTPQFH